MAIGTSITPRGYNIDTTGKAYTLDPDPLLNVAARSFASQQENQRQMQAVAQQGISIGEYIGARQQLGRVKAQLSELDVNDPLFAQKYSAVVADNPLAFTNEKLAPVTRAAVTPVLAAAAQGMENRAALQRAQVMAGYQRQQMDYRAGLQQDYYNHQIQNPRPPAPHRVTAGERLMFGAGATPAAAPPASTQQQPAAAPQGSSYEEDYTVSPANAPQLPTGDDTYSGPSLFPDALSETPQGQAFEPDDTVTGEEGDSSAGTFSNGVLQTPGGVFDVSSVSADGITAAPRQVAATPEGAPPPGKQWTPKKFNVDNSVAEWGLEDVSPASVKEAQDAIDLVVGTDPEVVKLTSSAAALEARHKGLIAAADKMDDIEKAKIAPDIAASAIEASGAVSVAKLAADQKKLTLMAQRNPVAAAALAERKFDSDVQSMPFYGPTLDDLTATPPPEPAAQLTKPPPLSARAQLAPLKDAAAWDKEKRFALSEVQRIEGALGLDGQFTQAITSNNADEISVIFEAARAKGLKSPLLSQRKTPSLGPGGISSAEVDAFGESPTLKRSYRDILRRALEDPHYNSVTGSTKSTNRGYTLEPFVKTN